MSEASTRSEPKLVVLGVDPGLQQTGYAVVELTARSVRLLNAGFISSRASDPLSERLHEIATGLREVLEELPVSVMAIEQVFSHSQNPKTAILMAHVRGAILLCAAERRLPVLHYTPRQIKKTLTGSGRAGKDQVQRAVQTELRLASLLEPNDVADAAAVALCHCFAARPALLELEGAAR